MNHKILLERCNVLRRKLLSKGIDASVLFNIEGLGWEDLYYFSGFRGTSGALVVSRSECALITDGRYILQAKEQTPFKVVDRKDQDLVSVVKSLLADLGARVVGFNAKTLPTCLYLKFEKPAFEMVDICNVFASCRRKKCKEEIELIKVAAQLAGKAFLKLLDNLKPGVKETEVAARLEYEMKMLGAEGGWGDVDFIVASGVRSALPHGRPTSRVWQSGEWATLDFGARYTGYVSDITRNIIFGTPPSKAVEIHDLLCKAHVEAASRLKAGVMGREVDMVARKVLADGDMANFFIHSLGHGIGLEVHEMPRLASNSTDVLEEGDVVTIEPGVYVEGYGGMRVEDDYLVTDKGAQRLTADIPMELFVVMV